MNKEKGMLSRIVALFSKFMLMIGVVLAFYKLPGILAEKISYRELKKKNNQTGFDGGGIRFERYKFR